MKLFSDLSTRVESRDMLQLRNAWHLTASSYGIAFDFLSNSISLCLICVQVHYPNELIQQGQMDIRYSA